MVSSPRVVCTLSSCLSSRGCAGTGSHEEGVACRVFQVRVYHPPHPTTTPSMVIYCPILYISSWLSLTNWCAYEASANVVYKHSNGCFVSPLLVRRMVGGRGEGGQEMKGMCMVVSLSLTWLLNWPGRLWHMERHLVVLLHYWILKYAKIDEVAFFCAILRCLPWLALELKALGACMGSSCPNTTSLVHNKHIL